MSQAVIRINSISKCYRIGERVRYGSFRELLSNSIRALAGGGRKTNGGGDQELVWALRDISLEVEQGEVLGVIGRNGAGKSTLLKILSRITRPTKGTGEVYGRIGSLLEVGTGFHPELTGRENIYLNGAILGMRRSEIERKFDEIIAFAEIERFIDTPVKRYSTGMHMRLAFSVAAHLEPEILLVDEVLAVGDAAFQKKCLGKVGQVSRHGRTILFVSHNMAAVQSLCTRVIAIREGRLIADGDPKDVVSTYLHNSFPALTEQTWDDPTSAPGNEQVRLHRASVKRAGGSSLDRIDVRTPVRIEFEYWNLQPGAHLNLSLHVFNERGELIFNATPVNERKWYGKAFPAGLFRDTCIIPGDLLNDGTHRIQLLVVRDQGRIIYQHDDILAFDVLDSIETRAGAWYGRFPGAVRPKLEWRTELVDGAAEPGAMALTSQDEAR